MDRNGYVVWRWKNYANFLRSAKDHQEDGHLGLRCNGRFDTWTRTMVMGAESVPEAASNDSENPRKKHGLPLHEAQIARSHFGSRRGYCWSGLLFRAFWFKTS